MKSAILLLNSHSGTGTTVAIVFPSMFFYFFLKKLFKKLFLKNFLNILKKLFLKKLFKIQSKELLVGAQ